MSHNAHVLTRIAEAADGLRGHGLHWVKVHNQNRRDVKVSQKELGTEEGYTVMQVETEEHRHLKAAAGSKVEKIVVHFDGGATMTRYAKPPKGNTSSAEWIDALFFSPSAVDKFVVPYLASVYDDDYAREVHDQFVNGWKDGTVSVLCHVPPTVFEHCSAPTSHRPPSERRL